MRVSLRDFFGFHETVTEPEPLYEWRIREIISDATRKAEERREKEMEELADRVARKVVAILDKRQEMKYNG